MHANDFSWVSDHELVQSLTRSERRPSLLVRCPTRQREEVVTSLVSWCVAPVHVCRLPGELDLPPRKSGTILLDDVSALTLLQQMDLQDWLEAGGGAIQVVSVTSEPLWPLVTDGRFLEGLFYRLNVVTVEAKPVGR